MHLFYGFGSSALTIKTWLCIFEFLIFRFCRGTRWWAVSVCTPYADGTFPERVVSCRCAAPLGGKENLFPCLISPVNTIFLSIYRRSIVLRALRRDQSQRFSVVVCWEPFCLSIDRFIFSGDVGNGI